MMSHRLNEILNQLSLPIPPTLPEHPTNKQYVDSIKEDWLSFKQELAESMQAWRDEMEEQIQDAVKNAGDKVGDIRSWSFRPAELPWGWHFITGKYYEQTSPIGKVLMSFSTTYKYDWGITISGTTVRMYDPNKFFYGGLGRFPRFVNSSNRYPGSVEADAIRDITGSYSAARLHDGSVSSSGALSQGSSSSMQAPGGSSGGNHTRHNITFRASSVVPTAAENRPYNVGFTPAAYLGVPVE